MQYITRKGGFDSGHRVMNESMKCFSTHGHFYAYELTFSFEQMEDIGYAIDFKEIKRVACQWIDDFLDHGMILNPLDVDLIEVFTKLKTKIWLMSLNGKGKYCNPSVENIAKEVYLTMEVLFDTLYMNAPTKLKIHKVKIYETPNCSTICKASSLLPIEKVNFIGARAEEIQQYAKEKGVLEYDDRKGTPILDLIKSTMQDIKAKEDESSNTELKSINEWQLIKEMGAKDYLAKPTLDSVPGAFENPLYIGPNKTIQPPPHHEDPDYFNKVKKAGGVPGFRP